MDITQALQSILSFVWRLVRETVLFRVDNYSVTLFDVLIGSASLFFLIAFVNRCTGNSLATHGSNGREKYQQTSFADFPQRNDDDALKRMEQLLLYEVNRGKK